MKPYYDHSGITIYHGDCQEILPQLGKFDVVVTDPPYSSGRREKEFAPTVNTAVGLNMASEMAPVMAVFGASSGKGITYIRGCIKSLPHSRVLVWHRSYINSPAAGPWRWDLVLIHLFGKGCFGRPKESSLFQTEGTRKLSIEVGHKAPVPVAVMQWIIKPLVGVVLDPFVGSGSSLLAAKLFGRSGVGIDINEKYCEISAKRLDQQERSRGAQ